jgi:HK97 family phage major capsid protein
LADFAFDKESVTLTKLTAFIKISDEMVADSAAVRDYVNAQLPLMVRQDEEFLLATAIYLAAGTGGGGGFATDADIGGSNGFDAIAAGINVVQNFGFFNPDGVFIHPNDYWALAVTKSAVDGQYYSGGPYAGVPGGLWGGLREVISLSAPEGFPMVGAFSQGGQVWRKGGLSVDATNSNEDDFRNDLIAIRAEQRVGLAVYYPEAFVIVNLAS